LVACEFIFFAISSRQSAVTDCKALLVASMTRESGATTNADL